MRKIVLLLLVLVLAVACQKNTPPTRRALDPHVTARCTQTCDLNRDACFVMSRLRGILTNHCMTEWSFCINRCYGRHHER